MSCKYRSWQLRRVGCDITPHIHAAFVKPIVNSPYTPPQAALTTVGDSSHSIVPHWSFWTLLLPMALCAFCIMLPNHGVADDATPSIYVLFLYIWISSNELPPSWIYIVSHWSTLSSHLCNKFIVYFITTYISARVFPPPHTHTWIQKISNQIRSSQTTPSTASLRVDLPAFFSRLDLPYFVILYRK